MRRKRNVFFSTGKQPNQFNYIPNRRNLHVATTPCCISQNFNNLLDFLRVIEIFHSSTLVIMRSSRKYNKPNRKEQGDLALRVSCFSQFVTSAARLRTLSLKSIKRILGGRYLGRAHASLLPTIQWLPVTLVSEIPSKSDEGSSFSFWIPTPSSRCVQKAKKQFFSCANIQLIHIWMHLKEI